jgi:hypothetical protein
MVVIQLTYNKEIFECLVDDEDYEWIKNYRLALSRSGKLMYVRLFFDKSNKYKMLHREIMSKNNNIDFMEIDHKDRNPLNNQKINLRISTHAENGRNYGIKTNNTIGLKGVWKMRDKFQAGITFNNEKIHIGTFNSPEEAAKAYDSKAKELFKEFAYLNFPI